MYKLMQYSQQMDFFPLGLLLYKCNRQLKMTPDTVQSERQQTKLSKIQKSAEVYHPSQVSSYYTEHEHVHIQTTA